MASGATLIIASVCAAFAASELFYKIRPARVWGEKYTVWIPFVPLTAATILVVSAIWTRRVRPTATEVWFALMPSELLVSLTLALLVREVSFAAVMIWVFANTIFAPWWFMGFWVTTVIGSHVRGDSGSGSDTVRLDLRDGA